IAKELNMSYKKLLSNWVEYKKKSIKKNTVLEKIIKKLKIRGYIVASLSNVVDIHQKACNEKKIYSVFDFNILSFKVKLIKPDKRIYQLLLKKLKLPGNEVIFTDDYQSCLDGAKKLGINTLLFKNNQQFVKDLRKLGVKL
ncbi:MAG: HAD-IA family hydrolase, partial [archaeon]